MKESLKPMLASYGRSILAAAIALYLAGVTDPLDLLWSLVAGAAPVAIRYFDPNDKAFGKVPTAEEVQVALTKSPTKKPAAKPAAKKPATKK
jgi:hypothetical protein